MALMYLYKHYCNIFLNKNEEKYNINASAPLLSNILCFSIFKLCLSDKAVSVNCSK